VTRAPRDPLQAVPPPEAEADTTNRDMADQLAQAFAAATAESSRIIVDAISELKDAFNELPRANEDTGGPDLRVESDQSGDQKDDDGQKLDRLNQSLEQQIKLQEQLISIISSWD